MNSSIVQFGGAAAAQKCVNANGIEILSVGKNAMCGNINGKLKGCQDGYECAGAWEDGKLSGWCKQVNSQFKCAPVTQSAPIMPGEVKGNLSF